MSKIKVGVFPRQGEKKIRYMAYTRDYNPQWPGCCEHLVDAANGTEAKAKAIEAHKAEQYRIASGVAQPSDKREVVADSRSETKQGDPMTPETLKSGTVRRSRIDLLTPAEAAIRIAQIAVEEMAAHPALTDASNLLQQARDKVADYVDEELGIRGSKD